MSLSHAFGLCARISIARTSAPVLQQPIVRCTSLLRPSCSSQRLRTPDIGAQSAAYAATRNPAYRYPENLNIFNAGSVPVVASGTIRIFCWTALGYGCIYGPISLFLDGTAPWYTAPMIALMSTIPLLATGAWWGGYVHQINILLPSAARRSKEDLIRFASDIPLTAKLQLKSMWFRPWPVTKEVFFEDLRRLPQSRLRLSNLEWVPQGDLRAVAKTEIPMKDRIMKSIFGTYCVNVKQIKDRSREPGIWDKVWQQIPMTGESQTKQKIIERRTVLPSNRSIRAPNKETGLSKNPAMKRIDSRAKGATSSSPKKSSRPKSKP